MIVETIAQLCCNIIYGLFSTFEVFNLPYDLIATLNTILCYGVWVVGADLLLIFASSVALWIGIHFSIGLALWVYDKIPFV